jgi:hypothetical protein
MPLWITHVWNFLIAAQGVMFLVDPIKAHFLSPQIPVLRDLGKRPWTAWRIGCELFFIACFFQMAWMFVERSPWTESLAYLVFFTGVFVTSTYESLQPLYLRDDGMRVLTKLLWWWGPRFLPWSEFKRYEWVDATTLVVNPGWNQVTCLIPEEHVSSVKSFMQEKVPTHADSLDQLQVQRP